jgi:colanic acid/amylovoran biosynthesis glycosyltransferase
MSRFPKLTETFVLNEILAVERLGVDVDIYPLIRQREPLVQPDAIKLVRRAHYLPYISRAVLGSQLHFLRHRPRAYLGALATVIKGNVRSAWFLIAGLLLFPKVVHTARLIAEARTDHVHCHFATHPALAGLVVHRLTGIQFSFTAHGSDIHRDRTMLCQKVAEASFVVAISRANKTVIETECGTSGTDRIEVLHCGVDTSIFYPTPSGARHQGRLRVLSIGTLHEVKGQRYLIEACALLRETDVPFSCQLIGDGPDASQLQELVRRLSLEGHVAFLGRRTQVEVAGMLREADVLVASSVPSSDGRREGIPVVLMEAMSCGLPVVASRLSGIPELVSHNRSGILVAPADARGVADALRRLAAEPGLRDDLGAEARRKVERDFNLSTNASRLVAMFRAARA